MLLSMVAGSLLASCAGSPFGQTVERSLEADPQLEESPAFVDSENDNRERETPESTTDIETQADVSPSLNAVGSTTVSNEDLNQASALASVPEPGEADFIGPIWPSETASLGDNSNGPNKEAVERHSPPLAVANLDGVPEDIQLYIQDLQVLNVLEMSELDTKSVNTIEETASSFFTQAITRREYAQWLLQTHNVLYADEPGERIRVGNLTDGQAFQDIPATGPGFAAIQGLAAAGIIPSAFTGNSTAINFSPDAPLSREDLILWKIPLDIRAALPSTSPEAVAETWGFQDTASIDPFALKAIAADFQLGDFSNIRRAFGYTTLFRPDKAVTRAEAAAVLWRFGTQTDGRSAAEVMVYGEGEE